MRVWTSAAWAACAAGLGSAWAGPKMLKNGLSRVKRDNFTDIFCHLKLIEHGERFFVQQRWPGCFHADLERCAGFLPLARGILRGEPAACSGFDRYLEIRHQLACEFRAWRMNCC